MSTSSDFRDLLFELSAAKAKFIVVGAYAVMHYTEPRYTKDLDIWIEPTVRNAQRVRLALGKFGAPLRRITVDDLCAPDMVVQIGVEPVRVDILTNIRGVQFSAAYREAEMAQYADVRVRILSFEHVRAAKKAAARPHDLQDVEALDRARAKRNPPKSRRPKG